MKSRFLFASLLLLACGGGTSAPAITNMTFTPQTIAANTPGTFDVTFDFDTSADLQTIEFSLIQSPAGPTKTPQTFPVDNATGVHHGTLDAKLDLTFVTPGSYTFGLDVVDVNQTRSNQLTGTIVAQ